MLYQKSFRYSRLLIVTLILAVTTLAACAFTPVDRPVVEANQGSQQRLINLPQEQAVEVAGLAAKSMGYDLLVFSKASGHIKTNIKALPVEGNANCGAWHGVPLKGMASSALEIKIGEVDKGKSLVTVWGLWGTRIQGRNLYGMVTRDETFRCASLGTLENNYMEIVTRLADNWSPKKEKQAEKAIRKGEAAPSATSQQKPEKKEMAPSPATTSAQDSSTAAPPSEESDNPRLQKLKMLKTMGLLSEQEYQQEKAKMGLGGK